MFILKQTEKDGLMLR